MIRFVAPSATSALLPSPRPSSSRLACCAAAFLMALAVVTSARADEGKDGKCTIAVKGSSPTARACATGGRAAAKKVMKDMVKEAKASGQKFTCDGCHKDLDNYALTKNATEDFKKLEAVSKIK